MPELASNIESSDSQLSKQAESAATAMEVSQLYSFLANLYRAELSQDQLRALRTAEMKTVLTSVGITLEGDFWDRPEALLLEELAVEYTALFLGPGGHISPHESVQTEQQGSYWGDATTAVRNFITETGIEYRADYRGIPDHISIELEFLAELARRESVAWQQGDLPAAINCLEYQRDFIDEHLGRWVERFCNKVMQIAELPFYRDIAQLTTEFVSSETVAIAERLGSIASPAYPPSSAIPLAELDQARL